MVELHGPGGEQLVAVGFSIEQLRAGLGCPVVVR